MTYDCTDDILKHVELVGTNLQLCIANLLYRAKYHDASKLAEPEKSTFDAFTPLLKTCQYSIDPNSDYQKNLSAMSGALKHHYENNDHHPEYFKDGIQGMDLFQLTEFLCDNMASAEKSDNGNILNSLEINQKRFGYSDELKSILINTVKTLYACK